MSHPKSEIEGTSGPTKWTSVQQYLFLIKKKKKKMGRQYRKCTYFRGWGRMPSCQKWWVRGTVHETPPGKHRFCTWWGSTHPHTHPLQHKNTQLNLFCNGTFTLAIFSSERYFGFRSNISSWHIHIGYFFKWFLYLFYIFVYKNCSLEWVQHPFESEQFFSSFRKWLENCQCE